MLNYNSKLIEEAINEIATLPGIGKKTALRLVLFLLKNKLEHTERLTGALKNLREKIQYCSSCHNVSDSPLCIICANPNRDHGLICVVEHIQDVIAIENTAQYAGVYHVLGGVIAPVEGIGPEHIRITSLLERIQKSSPKEIIFALPTTIEGDTTTFYITKKLKDLSIKLSSLARGLAIGSELEYTDEVTLARSIKERVICQ
jgi:recombination protein RecR